MADAALAIPTDPKELAEKWDEFSAWFQERCTAMRPLWEIRIKKAQENDKKRRGKKRSKAEIEEFVAKQSTAGLHALDAELTAMQLRTSIIVAAATLMFAAFVLKGNSDKGVWVAIGTVLLAISLLSTALSFILAILALAPPIKKAWGQSYDDRVYWDLLVTDHFEVYVLNSWWANNRTPILTRYKKAHSVAVVALGFAATLTLPGLIFVFLG